MIIAQITDLHISAPGNVRDDGFDPAADAEKAVDVLKNWRPRPDLVLLTGDLVDEGTEAEYRRLKEIVSGLPIPYYLMPGNHDRREAMRAVFGPLPYDGTDEPFMQYVLDADPVRIVALDTLEPGLIGGVLCAERLAWFEAALAQAPQVPTLVALHHPPFVTGIVGLDDCGFEGMQALRRLIEDNRQVRLVISGHSHRTIWTGIGRAPACTCPSTTFALAAEFRPDGPFRKTAEASGLMLHVWQNDRGESGDFVSHTVLLNDTSAL